MSNSSTQLGEEITTVRQNLTTAQISSEVLMARSIFPAATDIAEMQINRDAQISGRPDEAKISEIKGSSGLVGYRVESKVVSRSGPFKIRIFLDKQFYVRRATVVSYPWDRGRDVCKRTFTSQFEGKGPEDPIQLGKDIDAITGATISCHVMTEGIRDSIRLLKTIINQQVEQKGL